MHREVKDVKMLCMFVPCSISKDAIPLHQRVLKKNYIVVVSANSGHVHKSLGSVKIRLISYD